MLANLSGLIKAIFLGAPRPGVHHLRRGMTVRRNVPWHRFVRDLHGALGVWSVLLVLLWAVTGIYFAFPGPFDSLADVLES
jgi:hypothetical protein